MSNIYILLVEDRARALKFCDDDSKDEPYNSRYINWLDRHMLVSLLAAVKGEPAPTGLNWKSKELDQVELVYEGGAGPWMWEIPAEIVRHLAGLKTKTALNALARKWKENEPDLQWDPVTDITSLLSEIQNASDEAVSSGKSVFVYQC